MSDCRSRRPNSAVIGACARKDTITLQKNIELNCKNERNRVSPPPLFLLTNKKVPVWQNWQVVNINRRSGQRPSFRLGNSRTLFQIAVLAQPSTLVAVFDRVEPNWIYYPVIKSTRGTWSVRQQSAGHFGWNCKSLNQVVINDLPRIECYCALLYYFLYYLTIPSGSNRANCVFRAKEKKGSKRKNRARSGTHRSKNKSLKSASRRKGLRLAVLLMLALLIMKQVKIIKFTRRFSGRQPQRGHKVENLLVAANRVPTLSRKNYS